MSIAGGVDQAVLRGKKLHCETIQIFVKSNVQWRMRLLRQGERERFLAARRECGIEPIFAHCSYLINLASANRTVRLKSIATLKAEIRRSADLRLPFIVVHPGSHGGRGEREGIGKIVDALDEILEETRGLAVHILLETMAGQGSSLGYRFDHLAEIIAAAAQPRRLGVCFDTCHVFAAGYDIRTEKGYGKVMEELDKVLGLGRVKACHLNDCKGALGSHLDRHEHIGKGRLGKKVFALLLNDKRLGGLPMVLETPKGKEMKEDRRNLRVLRSLLA
jgi:deoxyribonuclease-4